MISRVEAEEHLVKVGDWFKAPKNALRIVAELEQEYGGNIAVGNHPDIGWYVLHDQGEGVDLVWKERD
mgnify:CR=1 FL=1